MPYKHQHIGTKLEAEKNESALRQLRDDAWNYYQYADNLLHQRHAIFLVAQSIFFAAFTSANNDNIQWVVAVLGVLISVLWIAISERLQAGLAYFRRHINEPLFEGYFGALDAHSRFTARLILHWILPVTMGIAWLYLIKSELMA